MVYQPVSCWISVVNIEHEHRDHYREGDQNHGEEQILPDQGYHERCRGYDLSYHKKKDSKCQ